MDMLGVTFIAVSKVIVSVLIGVVTTSSIPNGNTTLRDFGFLISAVLLTSLTFSNTAQSVNIDLLVRCSILILFSVLMIVWGLMWGAICGTVLFRSNPNLSGIPLELRKDVRLDLLFDEEEAAEEEPAPSPAASPNGPNPPSANAGEKKKKKKKKKTRVPYVAVVLSEHLREVGVDGSDIVPSLEIPDKSLEDTAGYKWAMLVAMSTQNGVTLPISLLTNIASSVAFVSFSEAAAYIFVFAISYMLYIWAAGPALVEQGEKASKKQRLIREMIAKHKRMTGRCDAMTQTLSFPVDHVLLEDGDGVGTDVGTFPITQHEGNPLSGARRGPRSGSDDESSDDTATPGGNHSFSSRSAASRSVSSGSFANAEAQTQSNLLSAQDTRFTSAAVGFAVPDAPSVMSPNTAGRYAFTMATAEQIPYDWQAAAFIRVKYEHEVRQLKKKTTAEKLTNFRRATWSLVRKLMVNPPFLSVVAGLVVGVIAPLRGLFFDGGALEMLMDAITLIGQGSIPASLLLLGANLLGSAVGGGSGAADAVRMRHAEQNTEYPLREADWRLLGEDRNYATWYDNEHETIEYDLHTSFSLQTLRLLSHGPTAYVSTSAGHVDVPPPLEDEEADADRKPTNAMLAGVQTTFSLGGISKSFVWGIIALRLIIAPAFSFVALVFMIKTMPFLFGGRGTYDKTLIMVLMVELASPTAINSTLIFNARQFMTFPWAKMLFFQYILCTITMVMWASLGLSYVSKLE